MSNDSPLDGASPVGNAQNGYIPTERRVLVAIRDFSVPVLFVFVEPF